MISKRIYWIFYWGKRGIALLCRYWIFFLFLLLCTIKMIANRNTSLPSQKRIRDDKGACYLIPTRLSDTFGDCCHWEYCLIKVYLHVVSVSILLRSLCKGQDVNDTPIWLLFMVEKEQHVFCFSKMSAESTVNSSRISTHSLEGTSTVLTACFTWK